MSFSWQQLFDEHGVHYVLTGKNVGKGHIGVKCPFCGAADPSEHMSIALNGSGWRCWRNREHSGVKPHRLIRALTNLSTAAIDQLVGDDGKYLPTDFMSAVRDMLGEQPRLARGKPPVIEMPKEFRKLAETETNAAKPYVYYLRMRGFSFPQIARYDLRFAVSGEFTGRVIFPVRNRRGELIAYTGRTIGKRGLRYKSSGPEINEALLFEERLFDINERKRVLVVTEGPFDALKVDVLGREHGIAGTCVFTSGPSPRQIATLRLLTVRYDRVIAFFDHENEQASFRLAGEIPGVEPVPLPSRFKDPGELRCTADLLSAVDRAYAGQKPGYFVRSAPTGY